MIAAIQESCPYLGSIREIHYWKGGLSVPEWIAKTRTHFAKELDENEW